MDVGDVEVLKGTLVFLLFLVVVHCFLKCIMF